MSKLYTEEQVRNMLNGILLLSSSVDDAINSLTPIELPTDEEVKAFAMRYYNVVGGSHYVSIGAHFVIGKIKGGGNESK